MFFPVPQFFKLSKTYVSLILPKKHRCHICDAFEIRKLAKSEYNHHRINEWSEREKNERKNRSMKCLLWMYNLFYSVQNEMLLKTNLIVETFTNLFIKCLGRYGLFSPRNQKCVSCKTKAVEIYYYFLKWKTSRFRKAL